MKSRVFLVIAIVAAIVYVFGVDLKLERWMEIAAFCTAIVSLCLWAFLDGLEYIEDADVSGATHHT